MRNAYNASASRTDVNIYKRNIYMYVTSNDSELNELRRFVRGTLKYNCVCELIVSSGNGLVSHYSDVIMGTIASQITSLTIVYSDADQRKHQSSASGLCAGNYKWPVTRKMFSFDDVIMCLARSHDQNKCWLFVSWFFWNNLDKS